MRIEKCQMQEYVSSKHRWLDNIGERCRETSGLISAYVVLMKAVQYCGYGPFGPPYGPM